MVGDSVANMATAVSSHDVSMAKILEILNEWILFMNLEFFEPRANFTDVFSNIDDVKRSGFACQRQ